MDKLRRPSARETPTAPPYIRSLLARNQADGSNRTHRCCLGWKMWRKEASDDKSFHPTVPPLLHRTLSSTCAPVSLIFSRSLSDAAAVFLFSFVCVVEDCRFDQPVVGTMCPRSIVLSPIFHRYRGNRSGVKEPPLTAVKPFTL